MIIIIITFLYLYLFSSYSHFALLTLLHSRSKNPTSNPTLRTQRSRLAYHGDAVPLDGKIEFNKFNYLCRVGWATYTGKVPIWDSQTRTLTDFTTRFTLTVQTPSSAGPNKICYGNGVAFFLGPVGFEIPPNSAGGFLGLYSTSTSSSSRNQILHEKFDSFANPEWDPAFEHVGINNGSLKSAVLAPWNASLHSGNSTNV
ncbi:Legume lectin domain containing protein [Trema orientale]|uniref:Legume lectin domain containing protein n=1 Tax=Trema orientale TaxID=63057 RepID=A0A2P5FH16_TREOI|nr:Legume lectin domain containing protein [Trema orientale]